MIQSQKQYHFTLRLSEDNKQHIYAKLNHDPGPLTKFNKLYIIIKSVSIPVHKKKIDRCLNNQAVFLSIVLL